MNFDKNGLESMLALFSTFKKIDSVMNQARARIADLALYDIFGKFYDLLASLLESENSDITNEKVQDLLGLMKGTISLYCKCTPELKEYVKFELGSVYFLEINEFNKTNIQSYKAMAECIKSIIQDLSFDDVFYLSFEMCKENSTSEMKKYEDKINAEITSGMREDNLSEDKEDSLY